MTRAAGSVLCLLPPICRSVDRAGDRDSLLVLATVCRDGWSAAIPYIYKQLRVSRLEQWRQLLLDSSLSDAPPDSITDRRKHLLSLVKTLEVDCLPDGNISKTVQEYCDSAGLVVMLPHAKDLILSSQALEPPQFDDPPPRQLETHLRRVSLLQTIITPEHLCLQPPTPSGVRSTHPLISPFVLPFTKLRTIDHHCPSPNLHLPLLLPGTHPEVGRIHFDPVPQSERVDFTWVVERLKNRASVIASRLGHLDPQRQLEKGGLYARVEVVNNAVFARGTQDDEYSRVINARLEFHVGELFNDRREGIVEGDGGSVNVPGLKVYPAKSEVKCVVCGRKLYFIPVNDTWLTSTRLVGSVGQ
jgi:hypothetical protein